MNRRMMPAVRFLEVKEGEGECKNQICCCRRHQDKGGKDDLKIAMPRKDDAHANSTAQAFMVLSDIGLAAGEGGGAAQDAVEDEDDG